MGRRRANARGWGGAALVDPLEGFLPVADPLLDAPWEEPEYDDHIPNHRFANHHGPEAGPQFAPMCGADPWLSSAGRSDPGLSSAGPGSAAAGTGSVGFGAAEVVDRNQWLLRRAAWTDAGWFDAPLRPKVKRLLALPPGPALVSALADLPMHGGCPADPVTGHSPLAAPQATGSPELGHPGHPCACLIVITAAWAAVNSWADAGQTRATVNAVAAQPITVAVDADDPRMGTIGDPAVDECAPALRLSPRSCALRVESARALCQQPDLLAAVESGLLSSWAARLVSQDLGTLSASERDLVLDVLLARLRDRHDRGLRAWTFTELRAAVTRIVASVVADFSRARRRARQGRRVCVQDVGDGMAQLLAELPSETAHRIHRRLTAIARDLPTDDSRTRDQQRADVLTDLILDGPGWRGAEDGESRRGAQDGESRRGGKFGPGGHGSADGTPGDPPPGPRSHDPQPSDPGQSDPRPTGRPHPLPRPCGRCGEVDVVMDLATLLGLAEGPAILQDCGPIPAEVARELAADRAWRLWITDSVTGHVVGTSAATYRPPAALARLIRAREPHCRFPGCRAPADRCDLDHAVPWPGGSTSAGNVGPTCRRHHRLKTHGSWRVSASATTGVGPPGVHWSSPAGITSRDDPPRPLLDP